MTIVPSDCYELDMDDLGIILGMDWLCHFKAEIECDKQEVRLVGPKEKRVNYSKGTTGFRAKVVSSLRMKGLLRIESALWDGTSKSGRIKKASRRVVGERVHMTECFTLGGTYVVCAQEKWEYETMHRLT